MSQQYQVGQIVRAGDGNLYTWNGIAWIRTAEPRKARSWWWLWLIGLMVLVVLGVSLGGHGGGGGSTSTPEISNAKIDSSRQIEFDYYAASSCRNLTFQYTFFDSDGNQVGFFGGEDSHVVTSGNRYHITSTDLQLGESIDPSAVRFDVYASCHDS